MNIQQLQQYLYREIPLTKAMQFTINSYKNNCLTLQAPLAVNINHKGIVFGGSL